MDEHRDGAAAVVETMAAHGLDTVFGIPGTHNLERALATGRPTLLAVDLT